MPQLEDNEFIATFKVELPVVGEVNLYNQISYNIMERLGVGDIQPTNTNDLFCLEGDSLIYYWFENNGIITECMELTKKPYSMILNGLGYLNNNTKIGDLYDQILSLLIPEYYNNFNKGFKNNKKALPCIIFSENQLTESNSQMWDKLMQLIVPSIYGKNGVLPKFIIKPYEIKKTNSKFIKYFRSVEQLYEHKNTNTSIDEKWQYYIADCEYGLGLSSMIGKYGCQQEGIENAVNRNEI